MCPITTIMYITLSLVENIISAMLVYRKTTKHIIIVRRNIEGHYYTNSAYGFDTLYNSVQLAIRLCNLTLTVNVGGDCHRAISITGC